MEIIVWLLVGAAVLSGLAFMIMFVVMFLTTDD